MCTKCVGEQVDVKLITGDGNLFVPDFKGCVMHITDMAGMPPTKEKEPTVHYLFFLHVKNGKADGTWATGSKQL